MTALTPYSTLNQLLRSNFPFDGFGDLTSSLTSVDGMFKLNVEDSDNAYVITALLPGVAKDEVDIELNEGRLSITVEHKESEEDNSKNYLVKETKSWSASRGIYLKDAAVDNLTAKLDQGVLTISVPKQTQSNVTKVTID